MIIWSSTNCPTVICLPTVCYFSREKPLVKSMTPGSILYHICFEFFYLHLLFHVLSRSIYPIFHKLIYLFTMEGLTTPLTRRVASICYLCAGTVYIVLLGSPTGSITLVSSLREIPTVAMLHHPFLFGEIPTYFQPHQKKFLAPLPGRHHQHLPGS